MSCVEYSSFSAYVDSKKTLLERIQAIDVLIDKSLLLMLDTVEGAGGNISSYELDDGQVRIKTAYRSITEVEAGIKALERTKQIYVNRYNGRSVVLRDHKTFR